MSYNEFNYYKEENKFPENKSIDILSINKKDKEISSPHSDVYKSKEYGGNSSNIKQKDNNNIIKKLLQKVTESTSSFISGVSATAAVVISSVVLLSNVILNKPVIELIDLVEGYNYVEYNISLTDIDENTNYYVLIDNSFESYQFELDVGENEKLVQDLKSNSVYNLSVIGINEENKEEVKYYTTRFFTKNIQNEYKVTWLSNGNIIKEEYMLEGQIPSYNGEIPIKEATHLYEYEFIGWDKDLNIITKDIEFNAVFKEFEKPLIFDEPTIILEDKLVLSGVDEYELYYMIKTDNVDSEQYNSITFDITYSDGTREIITVTEFIVNEINILKLTVPSFASSINIEYYQTNVNGIKQYELTNEYNLTRKLVSNEYEKSAILEFNYHFIDENITIAVKDKETDEVVLMDLYSNGITLYPDTSASIKEYSYYLSNIDGTAIENETTISIDYTEVTGEYNFNYINPSDAVVTYNDDGTINIYLGTTFETNDPNIYYSVVYTNFETGQTKEIYYTTSVAKYENAPFADYGISYYVYKKVNDIEHILKEIYVSGGIEFTGYLNINGQITTEDNINYKISYEFYDYMYQFDENSFILIVDGINYAVDNTNVTYDQNNNSYIFTYILDFKPTYIEASFMGTLHSENYDLINEYIKGNKYTTIQIYFYL